jgi:hypothetical protein
VGDAIRHGRIRCRLGARFKTSVARALQFLTGFARIVLDREIAHGRKTGNFTMAGEGRLLWLTPLEWSMLLVTAALCSCLTLFVS